MLWVARVLTTSPLLGYRYREGIKDERLHIQFLFSDQCSVTMTRWACYQHLDCIYGLNIFYVNIERRRKEI